MSLTEATSASLRSRKLTHDEAMMLKIKEVWIPKMMEHLRAQSKGLPSDESQAQLQVERGRLLAAEEALHAERAAGQAAMQAVEAQLSSALAEKAAAEEELRRRRREEASAEPRRLEREVKALRMELDQKAADVAVVHAKLLQETSAKEAGLAREAVLKDTLGRLQDVVKEVTMHRLNQLRAVEDDEEVAGLKRQRV